jgi:hypothetical protein
MDTSCSAVLPKETRWCAPEEGCVGGGWEGLVEIVEPSCCIVLSKEARSISLAVYALMSGPVPMPLPLNLLDLRSSVAPYCIGVAHHRGLPMREACILEPEAVWRQQASHKVLVIQLLRTGPCIYL